jgi:hypothetical protein
LNIITNEQIDEILSDAFEEKEEWLNSNILGALLLVLLI